ncbi:restriction endonuclease subunit S [Vibrio campbellii]|uniref:restriction endonuclease subunit S n=1 Tax=Vibrio campbellii TaxID=680 RepID=UPI0037368D01
MGNESFGGISVNTNLVKLKDITEKIGSGSTPRGGESAYLDQRESFAFVRSQNVYDFQFNEDGIRYITDVDAKKLKGVHLQPDDILLNITGDGLTFARCCLVSEDILPAAVNQHVCIIRVDKKKCLPNYLLAFLCLPQTKKYIESFNAGGSRRAITKGHIESFEVPLLPMVIQETISRNMQGLLEKHNLNNQINQTLEQMAQTLFKSWFVDYDPVIDNALDAGSSIPEVFEARVERRKAVRESADYKPLPDDVRQLFPSEFEESELGWVPKGWEAGSIGSVATAKGGYAFKSKQFLDVGNPVIKIKNITSSGTVNTSDCQCIDDHIAMTACRFKLVDGDLLMAMTGATVGKSGIYVSDGRNGYLNQRVARLESKVVRSSSCWFTYNLVTKSSIFEQIVSAAQGSAQPNISSKGIEQVKAVIPTHNLISKYQNIVDTSYAKWILNIKENRQLEKLRDTLLPKLISGELRLDSPEVEQTKALVD